MNIPTEQPTKLRAKSRSKLAVVLGAAALCHAVRDNKCFITQIMMVINESFEINVTMSKTLVRIFPLHGQKYFLVIWNWKARFQIQLAPNFILQIFHGDAPNSAKEGCKCLPSLSFLLLFFSISIRMVLRRYKSFQIYGLLLIRHGFKCLIIQQFNMLYGLYATAGVILTQLTHKVPKNIIRYSENYVIR